MPPKTTATKSVVYTGGLDSVTLHFLSGHVVTFPNGTPVEVCAEDASVLSNNSDFKAPTKAASTPTAKPSEEV
jgi:hypothetical protein